jgi:hypothetical protein
MRSCMATDHAGFELKMQLTAAVRATGHVVDQPLPGSHRWRPLRFTGATVVTADGRVGLWHRRQLSQVGFARNRNGSESTAKAT